MVTVTERFFVARISLAEMARFVTVSLRKAKDVRLRRARSRGPHSSCKRHCAKSLLPKNPVAGSGSSLFIVFAGLPLRSESVFFFLKKPVDLSGHLKKLLGVLLLCCSAAQFFPTFSIPPLHWGSSCRLRADTVSLPRVNSVGFWWIPHRDETRLTLATSTADVNGSTVMHGITRGWLPHNYA